MFSVISDATPLESICSWNKACLDLLSGVVGNSESNTCGTVWVNIWKKRYHMWNCSFRVQRAGINVWRALWKVESWSITEMPHVSLFNCLVPFLNNFVWSAIILRAIRVHMIMKCISLENVWFLIYMHISIHVIVSDNHILEGPTTYFLLRQSCPYPYCHLEVLSSDKTTCLGKRQLSSGISHMLSLTRGTLLLPPRSSAGIHYGKIPWVFCRFLLPPWSWTLILCTFIGFTESNIHL